MGLTAARVESVKSAKKPCGEDALDRQGDAAFDMVMNLHMVGFNELPDRTGRGTLLVGAFR